MPELPEVETMRRGVARLVGMTIAAVAFPRSRVRPLAVAPRPQAVARWLTGGRIVAVERFGKRLALAVSRPESGSPGELRWLVVEPRMTGLMLVGQPPTAAHVRMRIDLRLRPSARRQRLIFWDQRGLGTIRLLDARGLEEACGSAVLGADGLPITAAALRDRLSRSKRAIKVALLDQRAVAGIGNIYAAEILHRSAIDPRTPCRRIDGDTWLRIADTARRLLAEAVRFEGSSIGDELYRTPDGRLGRFQRRHRVYGRAGEPCTTCGTAIERIVQAQRATFFCPCCQPLTPRRRWRPKAR